MIQQKQPDFDILWILPVTGSMAWSNVKLNMHMHHKNTFLKTNSLFIVLQHDS